MEPTGVRSVAIVVVTYNSAELLPAFFESLDAALRGIDRFQIVIADNASADGTLEVARRLRPSATIVSIDSNQGYAAGINAGVLASEPAEAILVLNDDVRLKPGAVSALFDVLDDAAVGVAVPRLFDRNGHLLLSQRREPTIATVFAEALLGGKRAGSIRSMSEVVQDPAAYESQTDITWASGCAWLIANRCWHDVGPWDESFFLYAEDLDYALRARDAGYCMRFTPIAEAVHLVGPSKSDPRLWSMLTWNRYRLFRRRHGRAMSGLFWMGLVINEALRSIAGNSIHRAGFAVLVFPSKRPVEVRGR